MSAPLGKLPLRERLRAQHEDRFGRAVLVTFCVGAFLAGVQAFTGIVISLVARGTNATVKPAAFAILGLLPACLTILLLIHLYFWPAVMLAEYVTRDYQKRRYWAEAIWTAFFLGVLCPILPLLIFSGIASGNPTAPHWQPLSAVIAWLTLWLVLLPFQAIYWWCVKSVQLRYSLPQIFSWTNAAEQARTLFSPP